MAKTFLETGSGPLSLAHKFHASGRADTLDHMRTRNTYAAAACPSHSKRFTAHAGPCS